MTPPLSTADAATYLGVTVRTLSLWREKRRGPAYIRVGKRVVYRQVDLDDWLARHRNDPEAPRKRKAEVVMPSSHLRVAR